MLESRTFHIKSNAALQSNAAPRMVLVVDTIDEMPSMQIKLSET